MQHRTLQDVMTHEVVTVRPHSTFKEIVELLHRNDITAVPVVDAQNHPIGVVSEADLIHKEVALPDPEGHVPRAWMPPRDRHRGEAETADGLMTRLVITARPEWSIVETARVMDRNKVKRLPVVDETGMLAGIVSLSDLLELFLRQDTAIREEITRDVLGRTLRLPEDAVRVTVQDGVVTLTGTVDKKSLIPIIERLAGSVDGVVSVHQKLDYDFDDTGIPR